MRSDLLSGGIRRFRDAFLPRISRMTRIRNEGSPILSQRAQICFWPNPSLPCHPHPGPLPLARERENRRPPTGKPTAELAGRPHKSPRPFRCCSFSQGEKVRMRASHSQKQIPAWFVRRICACEISAMRTPQTEAAAIGRRGWSKVPGLSPAAGDSFRASRSDRSRRLW